MCNVQIVNNHVTCEEETGLHEERTEDYPVLSQDQYLSLFGAKRYGQLHHQNWPAINMKRFHKSMIFKI